MQRKAFYKRTRRGKVIRIVEEKYMRSDLGCGYMHGKEVTTSALQGLVSDATHKQLLIVDTNVALHNIDILEHKCPATSLVIILQTVLQELRNLNLSVYRRLLQLMRDEQRTYLFFPNELCEDTFVLREVKETMNDSNDRAIRSATTHLGNVLERKGTVIMLSNDADNRRKAIECGIDAVSMHSYVQRFLHEYPELLDLLAADTVMTGGSEDSVNQPRNLFPPHVTSTEISAGLRMKKYKKGTLRVRRDDWTQCYVVVHGEEGQPRQSVSISGSYNVNRGMDGDVVAVQVIDAKQHGRNIDSPAAAVDAAPSAPTAAAAIADDTLQPDQEFEEGLTSCDNTVSTEGGKGVHGGGLCGRVVGIIRRNWRQYAGSLDASGFGEKQDVAEAAAVDSSGTSTRILFRASDQRLPAVEIQTRRREQLVGNRLLVSVDHWPRHSPVPQGHYVRTLGKCGEKSVETQLLLHEFDVPNDDFSPAVMACLPPPDWKITKEIVAQRTDLRHLPVVSIDPPGCKDIDDALHAIRLPNGHLQVGVHIADVTHFLHPDTPLDKEAAHRSTSTYLVERRLDMLPGLLTTQLCSLRSKEDHLAFSVLWEMDDDANIVDVSFCKSVIHSVSSLTYAEAQAMLDDPHNNGTVESSVKTLNRLARIFRQRRIDMGALTLASTEVRFKLDSESQNPTDVSMYALKESNALVEEFMLLANITVSKKVLRHFPTLGVLRRHQPPSREQFAPLLSAAATVGVRLDISSSKTLADSLDAAERPNDPYFNKLLRILSTRCMMPAQYFCSGEIPKDQWHHYGLAAPVYTHFTSPIRRYADVIVHRLLAASIGVISLPAANADRSRQQDLCSHMNRRHRAAQYVQRASVNLHTLLYFKNRPSEEPAYVLSVNEEQFVVLIPKFGIEGVIRFDMVSQHMPRGTIVEHDADKHCARMVSDGGSGSGSGSGSGKEVFKVRVFQQVRVCIRVRESSAGDRKLVIGLVHEGKALLDEADAIATDGDTMEVIVDDEDIIDGDGDDDDDDDDDDDMNSSSTAGIAGRSGMKRSLGAAERSPKRSKKSAPARGTRSKR